MSHPPPSHSDTANPLTLLRQPPTKRQREQDLLDQTYAASTFGGIGDYLRNKRAKLQLQNAELAPSPTSAIFAHLTIYINGYTAPPPAELRRLFLEHGGRVEPYLDRKAGGFVTHVVAENLTPAKMHEYRQLKVVRPQWIVESVGAGRLLAWSRYRWTPTDGLGGLTSSSSGGGGGGGGGKAIGFGGPAASGQAGPTRGKVVKVQTLDQAFKRQQQPASPAAAGEVVDDDDDDDLLVMDPPPPPPPPPPPAVDRQPRRPKRAATEAAAAPPPPPSSSSRAGDDGGKRSTPRPLGQVTSASSSSSPSSSFDVGGSRSSARLRTLHQHRRSSSSLSMAVSREEVQEKKEEEEEEEEGADRAPSLANDDDDDDEDGRAGPGSAPTSFVGEPSTTTADDALVVDPACAPPLGGAAVAPHGREAGDLGLPSSSVVGRIPTSPPSRPAAAPTSTLPPSTSSPPPPPRPSTSSTTPTTASASASTPTRPTAAALLATSKSHWHHTTENGQARKLMAASGWRERHTAVHQGFLEGYYANSRLHHLSTWKAELKLIVARAQADVSAASSAAASSSTSGAAASGARRVRMLAPGSQTTFPPGHTSNRVAAADDDDDNAAAGPLSGSKATGRPDSSRYSLAGHHLARSPSRLPLPPPLPPPPLPPPAAAPTAPYASHLRPPPEADDRLDPVVLHCDFDAFFVAVALRSRPHLRGKPVVVCHSTGVGPGGGGGGGGGGEEEGAGGGEGSTSEVASGSYEARAFDIRAGMSLGQARKLCPTVQAVPYEFEQYKDTALKAYTILLAYADVLQAVSVDEALLDVSARVRALGAAAGGGEGRDWAKVLAERIRDDVRAATGCEISIGIASNILLARLATRKAKPAGSYHLLPDEVEGFLDPLDVKDLWGVGRNTRDKIALAFKTTRVGELRTRRVGQLQAVLGPKVGQTLYDALRGVDGKRVESESERKSVSAEVNYGIRFKTQAEAETFLLGLAGEVARRLRTIDRLGRMLTLKVMVRAEGAPVEAPKFMGHGLCNDINRSKDVAGPRGTATDNVAVLAKAAVALLKTMNVPPEELRGIGMMVTKLEGRTPAVKPREAGQTALSFAVKPAPAPARASKTVASRSPSPMVVDPPAAHPGKPDASMAPPAAPPGTPFGAIPTLSQVPQDVLDALPSSVLRETYPDYYQRRARPLPPVVIDSPASEDAAPGPSAGRPQPADGSPQPADGSPQKRRAPLPDVSHIARQLRPARQSPVKPGIGLFPKQQQQQQQPVNAVAGPSARPSPQRKGSDTIVLAAGGVGSDDDEVIELARLLGWDLDFLQGLPREDLRHLVQEGREQRKELDQAAAAASAAAGRADKGKGKQPAWLTVDSPTAGRRSKTASRSPEKTPSKLVVSPAGGVDDGTSASPYPPPPILGQRKKLDAATLAAGQPLDTLRDTVSDWVASEAADGPSVKGTAMMADFLAACVDTRGNGNAARGIGVLRWWEHELQARWAAERPTGAARDEEGEGMTAGRAWWAAFRSCKARVDDVFVRRWGGPLVL